MVPLLSHVFLSYRIKPGSLFKWLKPQKLIPSPRSTDDTKSSKRFLNLLFLLLFTLKPSKPKDKK
ncbi:hypothetical protein SAMN06265218_11819 [Fodinibius sediminis]|uniref:Uncharacterized protein n=1 Tax=Fodinibius sediminis TaxID=1214077 RepID=A0A521ERN5_9BACT|nr:hypothetical protein SAMN06265218_11819 [Fodinibius sediminis]